LNFNNTIRNNLNAMKPERDYIYDKINRITKETFAGENPKLELFGSLITGLALESSDMDLAVTGLYIEDRYAVICELQKLASALQGWNCLESFKCIETASIPVIKLVSYEKLTQYRKLTFLS
jgi:DNA polymerase sigma